MIMHISHKSKVVFYDWYDIQNMFFKRCGDKRLRKRIDTKIEKSKPWNQVMINGREMFDEAEKNRILAVFDAAKSEAVKELEQEHNDYMAKNHPEIDPKYWRLYPW